MSTANHILCFTSFAPPQSSAHSLHRGPPAVQWTMWCQSHKRPLFGLLRSSGSRNVGSCAFSAASASGDSDGPPKLFVDGMDAARKVFDGLPQPVQSFPWAQLAWNFQGLILELLVAVMKYLSVPLLALSSLSEMSYCAHERKMWVIPVPFLFGLAVAGIFKNSVEELSSHLKDGGFPWHLVLIASFFALLKLPGPYYPYWGRLLIPHFANGGLWRMVWLVFLWYRRPNRSGEATHSV